MDNQEVIITLKQTEGVDSWEVKRVQDIVSTDFIHGTIESVADFYGVSKKSIKNTINKNKKELKDNGLKILKGEKLKVVRNSSPEFQELIPPNVRSFTLIPRRAMLNIGMLSSNSKVNQVLRDYLLNVEEIRNI